ncbi:DUF2345 domain-containing protein, partial [Vogesella facilis]
TDQDGKTATKGEGLAQAGQQPLLILSAPAGLVASTDNALTLAAGTNIDQVAQRDLNQTSGRRWLHNVGQHISLFVAGVKDRVTLKLIAAKGKVQLQAQSDAMELTADKDVTITSCKGKVVISAKQDILLTSGGGYIKLSGGNIDIHCPGTVSVKGAEHALSGPASMKIAPPTLPVGQTQLHIKREYHDEEPLPGAAYTATFADGSVRKGVLDADGQAHLNEVPPGAARVVFGPDPRSYKRKDQQPNPEYKSKLSEGDIQKLIAKHGGA